MKHFLLFLFAVATTQFSCAATEPDRLEIAILHKDDNNLLVWPIYSVPINTRINSDGNPCENGQRQCPLPTQTVLKLLGMKTAPSKWYGAAGSQFTNGGGYYVDNILDGLSDNFIGFITDGPWDGQSIALTSAPGLIAKKTFRQISGLPKHSGTRELLTKWLASYPADCAPECDPEIFVIANPANMTGTLVEYRLPDGLVVQHILQRSADFVTKMDENKSDENKRFKNYLTVQMWRILNRDGSAKELNSSVSVDSVDCEGGCGFRWEDPDVIGIHGHLYFVGTGNGKEVYGYYLFELKNGKFVLLRSLTGGS